MTDVSGTCAHRTRLATVYDACVKHDGVALVGARALQPRHATHIPDVARLAATPADASLLDISCSGGCPFAVAVCVPARPCSTSRPTYRRTRSAKRVVGESGEVQHAIADNSLDLCVTYNGRHCLPNTLAALGELARVLSREGRCGIRHVLRVGVAAGRPNHDVASRRGVGEDAARCRH
jgi:hypothetical protein